MHPLSRALIVCIDENFMTNALYFGVVQIFQYSQYAIPQKFRIGV